MEFWWFFAWLKPGMLPIVISARINKTGFLSKELVCLVRDFICFFFIFVLFRCKRVTHTEGKRTCSLFALSKPSLRCESALRACCGYYFCQCLPLHLVSCGLVCWQEAGVQPRPWGHTPATPLLLFSSTYWCLWELTNSRKTEKQTNKQNKINT